MLWQFNQSSFRDLLTRTDVLLSDSCKCYLKYRIALNLCLPHCLLDPMSVHSWPCLPGIMGFLVWDYLFTNAHDPASNGVYLSVRTGQHSD